MANREAPAENTPDRARRIRELVREWVGAVDTSESLNALPAFYSYDVKKLVEQAADTIDAIDDAEIPEKMCRRFPD